MEAINLRPWVIWTLSLYAPLTAIAGVPTDQTRSTVDKIISILKNPALQSESKKNERRKQLRAIIHPRFDFAEMAKRSLGMYWSRRTPQEQREFVTLFTDLLERSYVEKIESYNGEKIIYTGERRDGDHAQVRTNLVTKKGEEFSIDYSLRRVEGNWKVYDIVIENISLVNNYRSQFSRILGTAGFDELLERLRQKRPEMKELKG